MAIKGNYTFGQTGVTSTLAYLKINYCGAINDRADSFLTINGDIFHSKAIRDAKGTRLEPFAFSVKLSEITQAGSIIETAYNYLKTVPQFTSFIDD